MGTLWTGLPRREPGTLLRQTRFSPIHMNGRIKKYELRKEEVSTLEPHFQPIPLLPSQIGPEPGGILAGFRH